MTQRTSSKQAKRHSRRKRRNSIHKTILDCEKTSYASIPSSSKARKGRNQYRSRASDSKQKSQKTPAEDLNVSTTSGNELEAIDNNVGIITSKNEGDESHFVKTQSADSPDDILKETESSEICSPESHIIDSQNERDLNDSVTSEIEKDTQEIDSEIEQIVTDSYVPGQFATDSLPANAECNDLNESDSYDDSIWDSHEEYDADTSKLHFPTSSYETDQMKLYDGDISDTYSLGVLDKENPTELDFESDKVDWNDEVEIDSKGSFSPLDKSIRMHERMEVAESLGVKRRIETHCSDDDTTNYEDEASLENRSPENESIEKEELKQDEENDIRHHELERKSSDSFDNNIVPPKSPTLHNSNEKPAHNAIEKPKSAYLVRFLEYYNVCNSILTEIESEMNQFDDKLETLKEEYEVENHFVTHVLFNDARKKQYDD